MVIEINPLDTLFFKDGKPFSRDEETWADGIFPPPPSVFYGALRTAYMAQHNLDMATINMEADPTRNLKITGISYFMGGNQVYPLPLDLVKKKADKDNTVFLLERTENNIISSLDTDEKNSVPFLLVPPFDQAENVENGYLTDDSQKEYLFGYDDEFKTLSLDDYCLTEPKVGIGRDSRTRTASEARLYRVGMLRLKKFQFIVEFENLSLNESGFLKLGGEGKAVTYQKTDRSTVPEQTKPTNNIFKLYLATPALLENGWLPKWIDTTDLKGKYPGTDLMVNLIAAATGKPLFIGGFDMKAREPKQMLKAVPPGSVYYFEIQDDIPEEQRAALKPARLCDYPERENEGFGITFMGAVK